MDRRTLLRMGAGMANGLGRPTPSRFPYPGRPESAPGLGASATSTVRARRVIIIGQNGGIFEYAPTMAFGNLYSSDTPIAGRDQAGNAYVAGKATYTKIGAVYLALSQQDNKITLYSSSSPGGPWAVANASTVYGAGTISNVASAWVEFSGALSASNSAFLFPSGDTTGTSDTNNFTGLLNSGFAVIMMPGVFYIKSPVIIPGQGYLKGTNPSWGIPTGNYGAGGLPLQGSIIQAGSAFAGAALVSMGSAGTTQQGGMRLREFTLSGTGAPAGTHGILSTGFVGGVKMRDMLVWGMPGDGLHAANDGTGGHNPDFWQVDSSKFSNCTGYGVWTQALSDSWFTNSEATGNGIDGWFIINGADSRYIGDRGSSNGTGNGWNLNSVAGFTGTLLFCACEANLNSTGINVTGSGTGTYVFDTFRVSGNTVKQFNYAAGATMGIDSNAAWNTSVVAPTFV